MRALKRYAAHAVAEWQNAARRREVLAQIEKHLDRRLTLKSAGGRGHDSNYLVLDDGRPLAVLRLLNPYKKRALPAAGLPFVLDPPDWRIAREAAVCALAAPLGLAPEPMWHTADAFLCRYLPLQPLHARLLRRPQEAWRMITAVVPRLQALHRAGVVHMDMSLANVLGDDDLGQLRFVDFEYTPAPHMTAGLSRLYDHLRLLESSWKFLPPAQRIDTRGWLDAFSEAIDADMQGADIEVLRPALGRLAAETPLWSDIRRRVAG